MATADSSPPIDLRRCTLRDLPATISYREKFDVLHRLLELLPTQYLDKDHRDQNRISEELVIVIIRAARQIIASQPNVVQIEPPVVVCGDLHGQYYDLMNILGRRPPPGAPFFSDLMEERRSRAAEAVSASGRQAPSKRPRSDETSPKTRSTPTHRYVFLGDYVDRGCRGIEVMLTLLALKILNPDDIVLLRGNHEEEHVASQYGFFDECKRRYSLRLFKVFCDLFRWLPVAAVVGESIFCVHGGISPQLEHIRNIPDARPCNVPRDGIVCDLLWSDPEVHLPPYSDGLFAPSSRNVSYLFSPEALDQFLETNDLDLVVRAHQVVEDGYQFFPPGQRRLVTIFGATNYCDEFENRAALLEVKENMSCSILTLERPTHEQHKFLVANRDP